MEAFFNISCLDDPWSIPATRVPEQFPAFEKASPVFGKVFAWTLTSCRGFAPRSDEPVPTIHAKGAAPIVVVGTTRDPATPFAWAVALAHQLDSGVLLRRDGDGHTGYHTGNACIDHAVESYLVSGIVPRTTPPADPADVDAARLLESRRGHADSHPDRPPYTSGRCPDVRRTRAARRLSSVGRAIHS